MKNKTLSPWIPITFLLLAGCDLEVIPPVEGNGQLRASFTYAVTNDCATSCAVQFTNTSQNADSFEWAFGDESASSSTEPNPSFSYTKSGNYQVNLTAHDGSNAHDTTITVTVEVGGIPAGSEDFMEHITSASNTINAETELNNALTNDNPNAILLVSTVLGANFERNQSAIAVQYVGNRWRIRYIDTSKSFTTGMTFNVLVKSITSTDAFVHTATNATRRESYITTMDHPQLNGNPTARVFVTAVREGTQNISNSALGVVYINNKWEIVNLDSSKPILENSKFNVYINTDNAESFVHTATVASITGDYTVIDNAMTNAKSAIKLFITASQGTSTSPLVNPRVTGAWYDDSGTDKWTVFNHNNEGMPFNARFNVLVVE